MDQTKPLLSPADRSRINSENGKKGAGKHTPEGKRISSRNALKHGQTGAGDLLTSEDQADLDAMLPHWIADLGPEGIAQGFLVRRMALLACRLERSAQQEAAVLDFKARQAIGAFDRTVQERVEELGKLLLNYVDQHHRDPTPFLDRPDICSWMAHEPIVLVMELKETVPGCDYLIDRWKELERMLSTDGFWHMDSKFKAIRLLGKRYETLMDDLLVGDIFACCHALHPTSERKDFWLESCKHATGLVDHRIAYSIRVEKMAERIPDDKLVALDYLHGIAAAEIAALEALREALMPLSDLNRAEAPIRSAIDDTKQGELRRRYETANERALHRCLADFVKLRKAGIGGEATPDVDAVTETQDESEDASSEAGPADALRNEAKWDGPEASELASPGLEMAPEGSNQGDSPPLMPV